MRVLQLIILCSYSFVLSCLWCLVYGCASFFLITDVLAIKTLILDQSVYFVFPRFVFWMAFNEVSFQFILNQWNYFIDLDKCNFLVSVRCSKQEQNCFSIFIDALFNDVDSGESIFLDCSSLFCPVGWVSFW